MAAMSQAAMSASAIGLPRPGLSASATLAASETLAPRRRASPAGSSRLCVDMLDLPLAVDAPAGEAVVVLVGEAERVGHRLLGLATHGDELGAGWLHAAGFIPGTALQHHRLAVPAPGHAEASEGFRMNRPLHRRLGPALSPVGRDHDLLDPAVARVGDAGDLVVARPLEAVAERRMGDEGFHLLQEVEAPGLAAWQDLRVG